MFNKKDYQSRRAAAEKRDELVLVHDRMPYTPREFGYMMHSTYEQALDKSDILICVTPWDSKSGKLCIYDQSMRSCAFHAKQLGKKIILVHPDDLSVLSQAQEYLP